MENSRLNKFTLMLCGVLVKSYANPLFYNGRLINKLPKHHWCNSYLCFSNYLFCTESDMYLLLKRTWSEAREPPHSGRGLKLHTVVHCGLMHGHISTSTGWAYRTHVPYITKVARLCLPLITKYLLPPHTATVGSCPQNIPININRDPNTRITSVTLRFIVFTGMLSAQIWRSMELQCNQKWTICAPAAAGLHASSHVLVCASLTPHPPSWVHHPTEK
jgi:hypothetical protein